MKYTTTFYGENGLSAVPLSCDTAGSHPVYCTAIGISSCDVILTSQAPVGNRRFQVSCIFVEYDLFWFRLTPDIRRIQSIPQSFYLYSSFDIKNDLISLNKVRSVNPS